MDTARRSTKRLSTAKELAQVVAAYYLECHQARVEGRPIGWMPPMNGGIEIFYAMGLQPVFPENWSPVCAAFGLTPANFEVSEGMGYSRDLCGYLRNITGYVHGDMNGPSVPLSGLPVPDMIMSFGGGCIPAMKIFHILENRFPEAKVFRADIPQVAVEDIRDHHVDYAVSEMHRFIEFLERTTNRRLDPEKLHEAVALSDEACGLWDEIMSFRRFRPTPISAAEIGIMFVMVTRQGTKTAVDFLTRVRDEVAERAASGIGVIGEEKIRLFWDNIPLWYNMGLFNYFEKAGGVMVAETYSAAWSLRLDTSDPIRALALKSLMSYSLVSCLSIDRRREMVLKACREYGIDGAVFHQNKSCVPITLGQADIRRALADEMGIPSIVIDADHMDSRNFSMAQFQTRADAFMEMLLEKKGA
ncbi:MAG TPA: 2-hydroxyacyl-CoA dehydratase family protein [Deltaproteobacteria bacterium]|nr:MAG: R-phenyllactate dehydratase subunit alpha precursor [Deltaproteobacteria bacterium ADurb.Bin072]HNQ86532.1 2-hydroxyacyl-CoA dehydratase family protein [Deltaproteobacteria bacterium]HOA44989.1 2-hydroxyacyl-CoA dehydratase family protein [Deltaproteobacteria bacterium]HOG84717.1 2-hydroxyacyl-CoA dehydratase family protein [Deltaproteobacteria bacterium]HPA76710.1 2-hydroxyacyl-CoA dehydratase family protein [Deltaproteobacteria bacterium]